MGRNAVPLGAVPLGAVPLGADRGMSLEMQGERSKEMFFFIFLK